MLEGDERRSGTGRTADEARKEADIEEVVEEVVEVVVVGD